MKQYWLIGMYLSAIVVANLMVATFGASVTIISAFLFIGLDITARDQLHDTWQGRKLWVKMFILIAVGSFISWILNRDAHLIAIASCIAFIISGLGDLLMYQVLHKKSWYIRVNGSNMISAAIDSIVFPWIAFGYPVWWIVLGQFSAKVFGGAVWAWIIKRLNLK